MEMSELIPKINALAHKKKSVGLTLAEQEEQNFLRGEYLKLIRAQVTAQLDSITVVDELPKQ